MFFFNDTATTEIYTLSLHDALPICPLRRRPAAVLPLPRERPTRRARARDHVGRRRLRLRRLHGGRWRDGSTRLRLLCGDRKSTRLNSSHANISYAVFCL